MKGSRNYSVHAETVPTFRHDADISAVRHSQSFGTCCTEGRRLRSYSCNEGDVQKTLGVETIKLVGNLSSELRASERWDAEYWREPHPEWYEKGAFVTRQKRRREIIRHLLRDTYQGEP